MKIVKLITLSSPAGMVYSATIVTDSPVKVLRQLWEAMDPLTRLWPDEKLMGVVKDRLFNFYTSVSKNNELWDVDIETLDKNAKHSELALNGAILQFLNFIEMKMKENCQIT